MRQAIFILNFLFTYHPQFPFLSPPPVLSTFPYPTFHSLPERIRPTMGESNWDKTKPLPTASRLSKAFHHKESTTKRQIMYQILMPQSGDPKPNQVTQLSPTCRRPSPSIHQIAHFISHVLIPSPLPQFTQEILSIFYSLGNPYAWDTFLQRQECRLTCQRSKDNFELLVLGI